MATERAIEILAKQLSRASLQKEHNPQISLNWPDKTDLPEDGWYFSPELISIYYLPCFQKLSEFEQKRLSFYEAVNFFSLNIHGEKKLLQGMSERLYMRWPKEISEYLHHFVAEENKHMSVFGRFCMDYAGKVYPSKHFSLEREYAPGEIDFLFFARVVIFEECVDYFNQAMAKDNRLVPIMRDINAYHHSEEARHLAFGRKFCKQILEDHWSGWGPATRVSIARYLQNYMSSTWKEYYNPLVYKDAGFNDSYAVYTSAWESPQRQRLRAEISSSSQSFLDELGLTNQLLEEAL